MEFCHTQNLKLKVKFVIFVCKQFCNYRCFVDFERKKQKIFTINFDKDWFSFLNKISFCHFKDVSS